MGVLRRYTLHTILTAILMCQENKGEAKNTKRHHSVLGEQNRKMCKVENLSRQRKGIQLAFGIEYVTLALRVFKVNDVRTYR